MKTIDKMKSDVISKLEKEININKKSKSSYINIEEVPFKDNFKDFKLWSNIQVLEEKDSYTLKELLAYDDIAFLRNVYRILLLREIDTFSQNHYLPLLRNNKMSKVAILWEIKNSSEGKKTDGKLIHKLRFHKYLDIQKNLFLRKIPIVRYLIKLIICIVKLPVFLDRISHFENFVKAKNTEDNLIIKDSLNSIILHRYEDSMDELSDMLQDKMDAFDLGLNEKLFSINCFINSLDQKIHKIENEKISMDAKMSALDCNIHSNREELNNSIANLVNLRDEISSLDDAFTVSKKQSEVVFLDLKKSITNDILILNQKINEIKSFENQNEVEFLDLKKSITNDILTLKEKNNEIKSLCLESNIRVSETNNELSNFKTSLHSSKVGVEVIEKKYSHLDEFISAVDFRLNSVINSHDNNYLDPNLPESVSEKADDFVEMSKSNFNFDNLNNYEDSDIFYSHFESAFYNHDIVSNKQKVYLPYIPKDSDNLWLDLGCGRGEFLNILKGEGIEAIGVDINKLEIDKLSKEGFNVLVSDINNFLRSSEQTYRGISALQVIEHVDFDYLRDFINLSYNLLETNGVIILETINPSTALGFSMFYMDVTHKKPLPQELVIFLLQYVGFKDVEIVYTGLIPYEYRKKSNKYNYHDYAIIGYKR